MSKGIFVDKTIGIPVRIGRTVTGELAYWLQVNRHRGGRSFIQAFLRNVRGLGNDVEDAGGCGGGICSQSGEALPSVGRGHSSEEVSVMGMERRASVILME